ncbi:MAG: hypothetical protein IRZ18_08595 [Clostridia bacterium]|nr:hypothetical protein [Clostridia bacterium]
MRRRWAIGALLAVVVGLGTWVLTPAGPTAKPARSAVSDWSLNGAHGKYVLKILDGALSGREEGVVRADFNCAPDRAGLSHCTDVIDLVAGGVLTVENTHAMSKVPCLGPGDRLVLTPSGSGWIVGLKE